MTTKREVKIRYQLVVGVGRAAPAQDFVYPLPAKWDGMTVKQREYWAVGILKQFNANWEFLGVAEKDS